MRVILRRLLMRLRLARLRHSPVERRSASSQVFHCCVQKTASQWIRTILSDANFYRYSGLLPFSYQIAWMQGYDPRRLAERRFSRAFPKNSVITPMYIDYPGYRSIRKTEDCTGFFVMRDPRDITVSWYFSTRYSHSLMADVPERRRQLEELSVRDGLLAMLDYLSDFGLFEALDSWVSLGSRDPSVALIRFEDLTGKKARETFSALLDHLGVVMPPAVLNQLLQAHSFRRLSGREPGVEDPRKHLRKGVSGDWRLYFDDTVASRFEKVSHNIVKRMGYGS